MDEKPRSIKAPILTPLALTLIGMISITSAAFALSLTHWLAFMVADEIWRQWELQRAHMLAFICQLGTLLTVHFL